VTRHDSRRVSPFGHPRITAYVRLPEAFRSLSRPSSPVRAKASTVRPCSLDRIDQHAPPSSGRRVDSGPPSYRTLHAWCSRLPLSTTYTQLPSTQVFKCNQDRGVPAQFVRLVSSCFRSRRTYSRLQKGGDPAAGSPTATLLRLRPSHRARLRRLPPLRVGSPTSGAPDSHGVTGGVYKARERIHRGVADPRLLAIPASCSRVTDCNPNLDQVFAIRSASRPRCALSWPL
jgi:hypothetical protein